MTDAREVLEYSFHEPATLQLSRVANCGYIGSCLERLVPRRRRDLDALVAAPDPSALVPALRACAAAEAHTFFEVVH